MTSCEVMAVTRHPRVCASRHTHRTWTVPTLTRATLLCGRPTRTASAGIATESAARADRPHRSSQQLQRMSPATNVSEGAGMMLESGRLALTMGLPDIRNVRFSPEKESS